MASMISVRPTASQINSARLRTGAMEQAILAKRGKTYLDNSIREGEGVFTGLLGEELPLARYSSFRRAPACDIFDYDLFDGLRENTFDVKTKACTSAPEQHYWCSVCAANINQRCTHYFFVRVLENLSCAWLCGVLPKDEFFRRAVFFKKGALDPTSNNGWRFSWDCYNVPISALWSPPWNEEIMNLQEARWQPQPYAFSM